MSIVLVETIILLCPTTGFPQIQGNHANPSRVILLVKQENYLHMILIKRIVSYVHTLHQLAFLNYESMRPSF